MAKTVTAAYLDALGKSTRVIVREVEIRRRYWDGGAFVFEVSPTIITVNKDLIEVGVISWKLDPVSRNKITASNVSITLLNEGWKYLETNTEDGFFDADATALIGYDPYRTEFKIKYGLQLADGTFEKLSLFTGLATDYIFNTTTGSVEITIIGLEVKLLELDAQRISSVFVDEAASPAAGDGANSVFTMRKSQWEAKDITVAGNPKRQGDLTDYTLENINDAENEAQIRFNPISVPDPGEAVLWSGRQWLLNSKIGVIVAAVCDAAGIGPAERDITEPNLPAIPQFVVEDTSGDFAAGTNIQNTTLNPGTINRRWFKLDDFPDNDFTNNPTWSIKSTGGGSWSAASGSLVATNPIGSGFPLISTTLQMSQGTWNFTLASSGSSRIYFLMNNDNNDGNGNVTGSGYALFVNASSGAFNLERIDGGTPTTIITGTGAPWTAGVHNVWIVRHSDNQWEIFLDSAVSRGTVVDSAHVNVQKFLCKLIANSPNTLQIDNIFVSRESGLGGSTPTDLAAEHDSKVFDLLAAPTAWGELERTHSLGGGTIDYLTAVADESFPGSGVPGAFDAFIAISGGGIIQSALKRFLKIRKVMNVAGGAAWWPAPDSPSVDRLVANFENSDLFVTSLDVLGKNGYEVIQRLAEVTDSEFGFDGDGKFFFRPKPVTAPSILSLNQSNYIMKVLSARAGYREVGNFAQITYGEYYKEFGSVEAGEVSPTSIERFGDRTIVKRIDDLLFANDANLAEALARVNYLNSYLPKWKFRLLCRIIPHADLSDPVDVSYFDSELLEQNIFGDPFQTGFPLFGGSSKKVLVRDMKCKILGIEYGTKAGECILDVEEILS